MYAKSSPKSKFAGHTQHGYLTRKLVHHHEKNVHHLGHNHQHQLDILDILYPHFHNLSKSVNDHLLNIWLKYKYQVFQFLTGHELFSHAFLHIPH